METKTEKTVVKFNLEVFITGGDEMMISGLNKIQFGDQSENVEMDLNTLQMPSKEIKVFRKCHGIYCDYSKDNQFFDDNDEKFSLFIMHDKNE